MKTSLISALLSVWAAVACAPSVAYLQEQPPQRATALLVIENQRTEEEWIYLERDGSKGRKLGRVEALTTDTLVLRDSDVIPGARFALDAIAFASGHADQSNPIIAEPGVVYRWQLAPMRGTNFLSQRSAH